MSAYPGHQAPVPAIVTAVVVAHNGTQWLGELVTGLRDQRRRPDRVVAVDTGSRDGSRELLAETFGHSVVIDAPARTGFGAAVDQAVRILPPAQPGEWLWLLHDDCAPAPEALSALLRLAAEVPSAAVLGPKLREWPNGRRLIEFGVTIAGSGNRETGLEFGEYDQGQHDIVRDVLAVSTAGMLVRRDVFERLGGFDQRFGLYRDDVDFGWRAVRAGHRVMVCPEALVFHAEASFRGIRRTPAVSGRPRRVDRRNAMHTLLVNSALWLVPFVALRLAIGAVSRVLALLIAKWPDAAYDEFMAAVGVFSRPDLIIVGRRRRAKFRRVSHRVIRRLMPPPWIGLQHAFDALLALVSVRTGTHAGSAKRVRRPVESGPVAEEAEDLSEETPGVLRWLVTRPPVLLLLALVILAVASARDLLGGGSLGGAALLPAPASVVDLWQRYVESWHPVDLGSDRGAPPYLAVVAILSTVLAGKVWLAVDVLILGAVPLAGLTCFLFARSVVGSQPLRLWMAGTYALLPAVTGAIAGGRLGTCVAIVVTPLLGIAVLRMVGARRTMVGSWNSAWAAGLLLAVMVAFVPAAYGVALLFGLAVSIGPWLRHSGSRGRVALALAVPPVALVPWLPTLADNPRSLLGEAGIASPGLADSQLAPMSLLFGSPGGPNAAPTWIYALLLLVALTAILRRDQSRGVLAAWLLSLVSLAVGLVQSRLVLQAEWISTPVPSWPGLAAALIALGWILAIGQAADGATRVFSQHSFSWRQPVAGLLAVVAFTTPVVAAGWWLIRGADGPLDRAPASAVPPYIRNAMHSPTHPRTLVIQADGGTVSYATLRNSVSRLGDGEVGASTTTLAGLDAIVGDLLSDAQHDSVAARLAGYGVGYVYLPPPADTRSVERLDTTPGLSRASAPRGAAAWQVDLPAGAARVVAGDGAGAGDGNAAATDDLGQILRHDDRRGTLSVPAGPSGRLLVLAEAADPGWQADLDGQPLRPARYDGWAQAFELPAEGGLLRLSHVAAMQGELLVVQGALILLFLIFALPTRARAGYPGADAGSGRRGGGRGRSDARGGGRSGRRSLVQGRADPPARAARQPVGDRPGDPANPSEPRDPTNPAGRPRRPREGVRP
ncbi:glycosyltransferase family 2 protein [Actinopolymorpha sp. B17G11]|uniref:glycosyltransferase family 2 protein n=1 Tax=Actinopolymorpha sp. B17G11 TaxID=3160861 RepID=UPI0032E433EB